MFAEFSSENKAVVVAQLTLTLVMGLASSEEIAVDRWLDSVVGSIRVFQWQLLL